MSQEFRLKNIDETRNHFLEEIEQKKLMSRKYKAFVHFWIIMNTFSI